VVKAAAAAVAIEGGALPLGGGLLALVRPALDLLEPDGVLAVLSTSPAAREDLPSWCRVERLDYLGREPMPDGRDRHLIRKTSGGRTERDAAAARPLPLREGRLLAADVLAAHPMPERARADTGFAPRGAAVEPGGPAYPFTLLERDHVAPPDVAALYDQAVASQWDATRDIPWEHVGGHPPEVEAAVGQIMTFLAENELSALYVPARFIPRLHPAYAEVAMFLATQLADEARHIDVFLKRARVVGGRLGVSSVTTARSLLSLLELEDFTEAAFLLSVLGEGTFLDLLRFVEEHAPDEATAELVRRARNDESRHVHFGLSHVRHALAHDPALYGRLEAAVRRRAATLHGVGGVPAPLQDALTVLAAGGTDPGDIARGHDTFRALLDTMHEGRMRRLRHAGFTAEQAQVLSDLHTPNFM
jgi:TusA-related sulfurtransferase